MPPTIDDVLPVSAEARPMWESSVPYFRESQRLDFELDEPGLRVWAELTVRDKPDTMRLAHALGITPRSSMLMDAREARLGPWVPPHPALEQPLTRPAFCNLAADAAFDYLTSLLGRRGLLLPIYVCQVDILAHFLTEYMDLPDAAARLAPLLSDFCMTRAGRLDIMEGPRREEGPIRG